MKVSTCAAIVTVMISIWPAPAPATHKAQVTDDHFPLGKGGTGKLLVVDSTDPRILGPGKCGHLFLGGFAFGHPDPRKSDPTAICGHGIIFVREHQTDTGRPPISINPIEAPLPPAPGEELAMDSGRIIRDLLPRLDKSEGDNLPLVVDIRNSILILDSRNAAKTAPKRLRPSVTTRPST